MFKTYKPRVKAHIVFHTFEPHLTSYIRLLAQFTWDALASRMSELSSRDSSDGPNLRGARAHKIEGDRGDGGRGVAHARVAAS